MREVTDFKEIFLHVFDFLPQEFDIGLESLHLHGSSLLQSFITFSHQLQTFGHLIRALLKTHAKIRYTSTFQWNTSMSKACVFSNKHRRDLAWCSGCSPQKWLAQAYMRLANQSFLYFLLLNEFVCVLWRSLGPRRPPLWSGTRPSPDSHTALGTCQPVYEPVSVPPAKPAGK